MDHRESGWLIPLVTIVLALALAVLPLPAPVEPFRPDWAAMILIYWSLAAPQQVGLFTAFWLGLALDTLSGALLGQHALALLAVAYITQRFHLRIRVFPIWQMSMTVLALLALYEFILFWVDGVAGRTVPVSARWLPAVTGALLWPLVLGYLDRTREDEGARI